MNRVVVFSVGIILVILTVSTCYLILSPPYFEKYGVGLFILLSSLLAVTFALLGWAVSSGITIITNTLTAIHTSRVSDNLDKHHSNIRRFNPTGEMIPLEKYNSEENIQLKDSLLHVLNYLEFVSLAIREGHYSEEICKKFYKTIFRTNYSQSRLIIENTQVEISPTAFENYIYYVKRWNPDI